MQTNAEKAFFNPGVTVDVIIFTVEDGALKILLVRRENPPFKGAHALPGGFVREGETTAGTAERVLRDKAGIGGVYMEQLYTFDSLDRDPRGQILSVSYFALIPRDRISIDELRAAEHPRFFPLKELPELAFDHARIAAYALKRLRDKVRYTNVVYSLLPERFTLSQLQKAYETVLDARLDKRNFRKKILEIGMLKATKEKESGGRRRPAALYRFGRKGMQALERPFLPND